MELELAAYLNKTDTVSLSYIDFEPNTAQLPIEIAKCLNTNMR